MRRTLNCSVVNSSVIVAGRHFVVVVPPFALWQVRILNLEHFEPHAKLCQVFRGKRCLKVLKKLGRGCLSPSHLFGITLLLDVMLMKSRLIMMVLSRMMRTHFANAVGLEKASKGFPGSLRRKKLSY